LETQLFLGYSIVILGIMIVYHFFKKKLPTEATPWLFTTSIFMLLATPVLYIGSLKIIYNPTAIIHFIPFFNNIRCNTRTVMMIELTLPLVAGYVWVQIIAKKGTLLYTHILPLLFLFFLIIEFKPKPYNLVLNSDIPPIYSDVKNSHNEKLLVMPTGVSDGLLHYGNLNNLDLFYQTYHQKSITGGYLSRVSDAVFNSYTNDSIMNTLMQLSESPNYAYAIPTNEQIKTFNNTFHIDMYLIKPEYINTNAEKYIWLLLTNKNIITTKNNNYELLEIK
jgi:hypothetical protein